MDKSNASWWQRHKPTARRLAQLYSALLYNAHIKGFINGSIYQGQAKYLCVPGLNCYSCPGAIGACPLGALQNALASANHRAGWYVLGMLMLFGVLLGRTICGWLCPVGLIQELLHKIPTLKIRKSRVTRQLSWLKYLLLAVFVVAIPFYYGLRHGLPLPAFCKFICPAGTSEGALGLLSNPANANLFTMLGVLFTRKLVILLLIGLFCVLCYRAFCRFLCPLGAIYSLFNRFNLVGVKVAMDQCNQCGACVRGCQMDVRHVGDRECVHCGKCVNMCAQGAISLKAGEIVLKGPQSGGRASSQVKRPTKAFTALRLLAVAVLGLALLWFNVLDPGLKKASPAVQEFTQQYDLTDSQTEQAPSSEAEESNAPAGSTEYEPDDSVVFGHDVGQRLSDFTLECYDGSQFRLSDNLGKTVFINIWATYCAPCLQELPYFDELYRTHLNDVVVLAVHPSLITDDPMAYIDGKGYDISFATDFDDDVYDLIGATGAYPQTVVLDREGIIVYNSVGSVTKEMLEEIYTQANQ